MPVAPPKKKPRMYYEADRGPPPLYPPKISRWAVSRKELKAGIEEKGWHFQMSLHSLPWTLAAQRPG
eukprot:3676916-Alexandrium_andersonii.AAC.1